MNPLRQLLSVLTGADRSSNGDDARLATLLAAESAELCAAVSDIDPCGPSLEYDNDYAVLQSRLSPKADVQYGAFSSKPDAPDWLEVERDARRLLQKSKDISILIWFTRARTRMAGAAGLLEGLSTLRALLLAHPQQIHPRLHVEGELDPAVRANALAALCDPDGLLGDVREVVVISNTASRLTIRDIERTFSVPRPPYAADPEYVGRQLADLHRRGDATLQALMACGACGADIAQWSLESLQGDAPDLSPLLKLLAALVPLQDSPLPPAQQQGETLSVSAMPDQPWRIPNSSGSHLNAPSDASLNTLPNGQFGAAAMLPLSTLVTAPGADTALQREHIRALMGQVRQWIEHHEPSSPVAVLLKQADRMWGKRFSEVAGQIPAELLQAWDRED